MAVVGLGPNHNPPATPRCQWEYQTAGGITVVRAPRGELEKIIRMTSPKKSGKAKAQEKAALRTDKVLGPGLEAASPRWSGGAADDSEAEAFEIES